MSIRVQHEPLAGAGALETSRTDGLGPSSKGRFDGASASTDSVDISPLSGNIAATLSSIGAQQASRVRQLAALYSSGRYEVEASKVSHAIVSQAIGSSSSTEAS